MKLGRELDDDGILTLTLDDGKKNALGIEFFEDLMGALDEHPSDDARAVVLTGREGVFSAGLDVKFIANASKDDMHELLTVFGQAMMHLWTDPRPTVCAATGHAIAAGTMLSMACDHSVAAFGDFKWGLTETQIDFELPQFGIVLARHNLRNDRLEDLLLPGAMIEAGEATEAGFADVLAPMDEVLQRAKAKARELAELPSSAYAGTKQRLRGQAAADVVDHLDQDIWLMLADFERRKAAQ